MQIVSRLGPGSGQVRQLDAVVRAARARGYQVRVDVECDPPETCEANHHLVQAFLPSDVKVRWHEAGSIVENRALLEGPDGPPLVVGQAPIARDFDAATMLDHFPIGTSYLTWTGAAVSQPGGRLGLQWDGAGVPLSKEVYRMTSVSEAEAFAALRELPKSELTSWLGIDAIECGERTLLHGYGRPDNEVNAAFGAVDYRSSLGRLLDTAAATRGNKTVDIVHHGAASALLETLNVHVGGLRGRICGVELIAEGKVRRFAYRRDLKKFVEVDALPNGSGRVVRVLDTDVAPDARDAMLPIVDGGMPNGDDGFFRELSRNPNTVRALPVFGAGTVGVRLAWLISNVVQGLPATSGRERLLDYLASTWSYDEELANAARTGNKRKAREAHTARLEALQHFEHLRHATDVLTTYRDVLRRVQATRGLDVGQYVELHQRRVGQHWGRIVMDGLLGPAD